MVVFGTISAPNPQGPISLRVNFTAGIKLVPYGSLQRSEYKSKLVRH
jgi:hypothetical protein